MSAARGQILNHPSISLGLILIRCPKCGKQSEIQRLPHDPKSAAVMIVTCPECVTGGWQDMIDYLDANGKAVFDDPK